jgi:hypothetical protein
MLCLANHPSDLDNLTYMVTGMELDLYHGDPDRVILSRANDIELFVLEDQRVFIKDYQSAW